MTARLAGRTRLDPAPPPSGAALCTWLLIGYAFLLPVQVETPFGVRLAPSDAAVLAYLIVRGARMRRVPAAWTAWHHSLVLVVWGGLLIALVRTGELATSVFVTKAVGLLVLVATFTAVVDAARDWDVLRRVLGAFVAGAVLHGGTGVLAFGLQRTAGITVPFVNDPFQSSRVTGLLIDPNAFGGLLATAMLLHLCAAAHGQPLLTRRWSRAADIVLPVALMATFSRSAWIGAVVGLLLVVVVDPIFAGKVLRRLVAPLSVALAGGLAVLPDLLSLASRPRQVEDRFVIGNAALQDFLDAPLLGIGLGVFSEDHGVIVHNTLLWFLTEMGLVGLCAFVGLVVTSLLRGRTVIRTAPRRQVGLATGLLAATGVGLGLSVGIEAAYQRSWWLVLAASGASFALVHQDAGPSARRS